MRKGLVLAAMVVSVFLAGMGVAAQTFGAAPQAAQQQQQIVMDDEIQDIPSDAIRLRIIANSDKPEDQQLKRDIRDQVIAAVAVELRGIDDEQAAREKISASVPKFNEIAEQVIAKEGFSYHAKTDFGQVPFPTKLYGDKVYPAGNYEALRIQIGEAQGQNWWCVLFPPLCFVDMANGDAVAQPKDMPEHAPIAKVDVKNADNGKEQQVEVRSALWDKVTEWWNKIFG